MVAHNPTIVTTARSRERRVRRGLGSIYKSFRDVFRADYDMTVFG
jgi:hypothetical protein